MAKFTVKGTLFKHGTAGSAPTTTVTQNGNLSAELGEREMVDVTTNDSPSGVREFAANFLNSANMTQEFLYDPDNVNHEALRAAHAGGTKISFGFTLPNTGAAIFYADGYVTNFSLPLDMTSALMANFAFKATGPYTFTA